MYKNIPATLSESNQNPFFLMLIYGYSDFNLLIILPGMLFTNRVPKINFKSTIKK